MDAAEGKIVKQELTSSGHKVEFFEANVAGVRASLLPLVVWHLCPVRAVFGADEASVKAFVAGVEAWGGHVDVLVRLHRLAFRMVA
jgi:hypothetical protein